MNNFGLVGYTGLSLQLVGLSLETIADLQKNSFKSSHRHSWCNVGVWKYSTHPNYLGEGLFWWGTYLAHGFHSPLPSVLATVGLGLILYVLKGSAKSLSSKQKEKYGQEVEFYQFQRTHNVFGPKQMWSRQQVVVSDAPIITESMTQNYDHSVSISKNGNAQEINQ
jgi:steroid 5-alpha reductase family enzyme